jgi:3'(2'), 5'-bisphosphate nucleotidase
LARRTQQRIVTANTKAAADSVAGGASAALTGVMTKKDTSPVTVADFGAQSVVCSILKQHFPYDPVCGEEDSSALQQDPALLARVVEEVRHVLGADTTVTQVTNAIDVGTFGGSPKGRFWTVDPIDGTLCT